MSATRDSGAPAPTRYLPALDGLRAVAVLLVVASHAAPAHVIPGGFGVTLFFFISGYLLTGQLLDEFARNGRIDFAGFYLRRALRLMPAALVFIAISGLFYVAIGGSLTLSAWLSALLYGANYYDIFVGYRSSVEVMGAAGPITVEHPFSILWSLAVEEHFYFLWPIALLVALRLGGWRGAALLLIGLCLLELGWRAYLYPLCHASAPGSVCGATPGIRLYAATDTRLDSIAFGALAAVLLMRQETRRLLGVLKTPALQASALGLLAAGFVVRDDLFREVARYTAQGAGFFVLIPALLTSRSPVRRLLEAKAAVFVGRISYSIYLWHWLAGMAASYAFAQRPVAQVAAYLALTAALSLLSWLAIETPMLALRRRAGSRARPPRLLEPSGDGPSKVFGAKPFAVPPGPRGRARL